MIHWQCVRSPLQKIITFVWGHRDFSKTCINALYLWLMLTALFSTTPPKSKISLSGFQFYSSLFIMFSRDSTNCISLPVSDFLANKRNYIFVHSKPTKHYRHYIILIWCENNALFFDDSHTKRNKIFKGKKSCFCNYFCVYSLFTSDCILCGNHKSGSKANINKTQRFELYYWLLTTK